jgi:hypothetical protein
LTIFEAISIGCGIVRLFCRKSSMTFPKIACDINAQGFVDRESKSNQEKTRDKIWSFLLSREARKEILLETLSPNSRGLGHQLFAQIIQNRCEQARMERRCFQ